MLYCHFIATNRQVKDIDLSVNKNELAIKRKREETHPYCRTVLCLCVREILLGR